MGSDRIVLITGSSGLLGQHFCKVLTDAGFRVVRVDVNSHKQFSKSNDDKLFYCADVSKEPEISDLFSQLLDAGLFPDVVINNAAINPKIEDMDGKFSSRLENYPLDVWEKELAVGLTGSLIVSQKYVECLIKKEKKGTIINIASDLSIIAPNHYLYNGPEVLDSVRIVKPVSYSIVKHGLIGLTRYLATYAPDFLTCNALSPGGVENGQPTDFVTKIKPLIPLKRMACLSDLDSALLFLCDERTRYVTGQNIVVDGGRSVW